MNRLLFAFVILLLPLISMSSFAEEQSSQAPTGQTTETQVPAPAPSAEEFKFEPSEIEKKPYHVGGYFEFRPTLFVLDKDAALYKLNFGTQNVGKTVEDYLERLWLEGSYEKGIFGVFLKANLGLDHTYQGWDHAARIYEGYGSLKPSSSLTVDLGKRVYNWGKGYAWNPVAFVDRPKDPEDPELPREGYTAATADYIRSFNGPLKTFSLSPILLPVYKNVNEDFGKIDHLNFAGKIYFLFYDTDIDLLFLTGQSKTNRVGFDFSRNLTTNLEVHGEFAYITNQQTTTVDRVGNVSVKEYDATSFLLGLRYLSSMDTTYLFEYYHNGTGYSSSELRSFYSFTDNAFDIYESTGNKKPFLKAETLFHGNYGKMNPGKDYLYLRISQNQPFDILYFTPALTTIMNLDDRSFSISPEIMYTGIKNWEFRLKGMALVGSHGTDYGEKQNDYKIEFRVRYYFSLP